VPVSTADVIARLNRQLFDSTPREKYATFFYAVYDGESRKLVYTNAGHLPPFLFRSNKVERLSVGGTVVGLFAGVTYEQSVIQIEPGDTILADRKSTRLNSSHVSISYAVFCLKKKKITNKILCMVILILYFCTIISDTKILIVFYVLFIII